MMSSYINFQQGEKAKLDLSFSKKVLKHALRHFLKYMQIEILSLKALFFKVLLLSIDILNGQCFKRTVLNIYSNRLAFFATQKKICTERASHNNFAALYVINNVIAMCPRAIKD